MLEFNIYPSMYIRGDELVIELEDQDGFYLSGCSISLIELKEALDALQSQSQSQENL